MVTYPSREEELEILARQVNAATASPRIDAVVTAGELLAARASLDDVSPDQRVLAYVLDWCARRATRPPSSCQAVAPLVRFGASPRAAAHFTQAARATAALAGRAYVLPEDVKAVAMDVLRHRLIRSYDAEADNVSADESWRSPGGGARCLMRRQPVRTMALEQLRPPALPRRTASPSASCGRARCRRPASTARCSAATGLNFAGYREYQHGDDIRMVDWNVTARQNRPMLKLFEQEHASALMLVLDASASMTGPHPDKWDAAAALAVLFALRGGARRRTDWR